MTASQKQSSVTAAETAHSPPLGLMEFSNVKFAEKTPEPAKFTKRLTRSSRRSSETSRGRRREPRGLVHGEHDATEQNRHADYQRTARTRLPPANDPSLWNAALIQIACVPITIAASRIGVAIGLLCVTYFLLPQPRPRYKPGEEPSAEEKTKE